MGDFTAFLKNNFSQLLEAYNVPNTKIEHLWLELKNKYTEEHRHYHNLNHLFQLLQELNEITDFLDDPHALLFALYYHDFFYEPQLKDNEEQSALFAVQLLSSISIDEHVNSNCEKIILATKSHQLSDNSDINFFTDADISILGADWEKYYVYAQNIRKEYSIYSDSQYHKGRKKVLNHFLAMPQIFKTDYFHEKFEKQSRKNLEHELTLL